MPVTERVYIPYQPKEGEIPPNGTQYRYRDRTTRNDSWDEWCENDDAGLAAEMYSERMHGVFEFRLPAPEEDDELWEDVPPDSIIQDGDRKSFKGEPFCDVTTADVGKQFSNGYLRIRRRKAVEQQKPPEKPLNTYLPYLLEKADKAIKGDQAKLDQINAAKAVFASRVMEIMGVTDE